MKIMGLFVMVIQVKELIQDDLNTKNIKKELEIILFGDGRDKVLDCYNELERVLDKKGASRETAEKIVNYHLPSNS